METFEILKFCNIDSFNYKIATILHKANILLKDDTLEYIKDVKFYNNLCLEIISKYDNIDDIIELSSDYNLLCDYIESLEASIILINLK